MDVDVSDAFAVEVVALDIAKNLIGFCNYCHRQLLEQLQSQCAIRQSAAGNLTHDKRVNDHCAPFQQIDKLSISTAKMVDPHRGVDQDQVPISWRRRGATFSFGWLLPSFARRLALSRSMSAFRPSRNNAERSSEPVSLMALASRSSSRFTVVRIRYLPWICTNISIS